MFYQAIQTEREPAIEEVESTLGVHLVFKPDEHLHHEQFDIMRV